MRPNLTPPEEPCRRRRGTTGGAINTAVTGPTNRPSPTTPGPWNWTRTLADAWFNRGCSFYELGMYDESIADLTQAIAIDPNDDNFYGRRSLAYLFSDRLEEAAGGPGLV